MPFGSDGGRFGFPDSNSNNNFDGSYNVTTTETNSDEGGKEEEEDGAFVLFESSPRYGALRNLMFSDNTRRLGRIEVDEMSYKVSVT